VGVERAQNAEILFASQDDRHRQEALDLEKGGYGMGTIMEVEAGVFDDDRRIGRQGFKAQSRNDSEVIA
jgi:hypothetical protein